MKPRIVAIDTPLQELIEEIFHTVACLRAHPFLTAQAAQFDALRPGWALIQQLELDLIREQLEAEARAMAIDRILNFLCMAIAGTLLVEAGGDRKGLVYQRYFGAIPPSKLKRPVLGQQLTVMREWPPSLTGPQNSPTLQAYGRQLAERVPEADAAARTLAEAEGKRADFLLGPRKAFVDQLNGTRQVLYGQLAEMPHRNPELNLARDFFLRDTRNRKRSITELEQIVERERERLRKHEAELARRLGEEEEDARQRAAEELSEAERELAAAAAARAEAAARLASLRARQRVD